MRNYEYIVAGLPVLSRDASTKERFDVDSIIAQIREQLSKKDNESVDFLLSSCTGSDLSPEMYAKAFKSSCRFTREYMKYDFLVRNAKVDYINKSLGRPEGMDIMTVEGMDLDSIEGRQQVDAVLYGTDILKRERGLDDLMWAKIDDLTGLQIFTIDYILGFVAKLMIIDRWFKLNPETGRELFRRLVEEIRSTYDNKKQNII